MSNKTTEPNVLTKVIGLVIILVIWIAILVGGSYLSDWRGPFLEEISS